MNSLGKSVQTVLIIVATAAAIFLFAHVCNTISHYYLMAHGSSSIGNVVSLGERSEVRYSTTQTYVTVSYGQPAQLLHRGIFPIAGNDGFAVGTPVPIHYSAAHPEWATLDYDNGQVLKDDVLTVLLLTVMGGIAAAKLRKRDSDAPKTMS